MGNEHGGVERDEVCDAADERAQPPGVPGQTGAPVLAVSSAFSRKGTPSADDLRGWATPVATDPRRDP